MNQPPATPRPHITCPDCHRTTWHPEDVLHGYCGACHAYTSPPAHDKGAAPKDRPQPPA